MAKYTTLLRDIILMKSGEDSITKAINSSDARKWLFDEELPWYNTVVENRLKTKIMRHYAMREIGFETAGLFKFEFNNSLYELLPKYNLMYAQLEKENFDILDDYYKMYKGTESEESGKEGNQNKTATDDDSIIKTGTENYSNSSNENSDIDTKNTTRVSDTPQNSLASIENNTYLSSATIQDNKGGTTSNANDSGENASNSSENRKRTNTDATNYSENQNRVKSDFSSESGHLGGSYADAIQNFVNAYVDLDKALILELRDNFMQIF